MKSPKILLPTILSLALSLFSAAPAWAQSNNLITPVITVSPPLFPAGQSSSVFLSVSNGNASSNKSIEAGEVFIFTFDAASGTGFSLQSPVLVNSSTFNPFDEGPATKVELSGVALLVESQSDSKSDVVMALTHHKFI